MVIRTGRTFLASSGIRLECCPRRGVSRSVVETGLGMVGGNLNSLSLLISFGSTLRGAG